MLIFPQLQEQVPDNFISCGNKNFVISEETSGSYRLRFTAISIEQKKNLADVTPNFNQPIK